MLLFFRMVFLLAPGIWWWWCSSHHAVLGWIFSMGSRHNEGFEIDCIVTASSADTLITVSLLLSLPSFLQKTTLYGEK
jgi:hypothetical protein